jgi:dihydrofolate reductase
VINRGEEGDKFKLAETLDTEALLLGRTTYEVVAASWPSRSGEFADKFNSLPKYVVSSTLEDPVWNNSTVLQGDVVDEASKLKLELDGEIVVHGSPRTGTSGTSPPRGAMRWTTSRRSNGEPSICSGGGSRDA